MPTDIPLIRIAAECPDAECNWISHGRQVELVLFAHLVEMHGYVDTTAHILAYEATARPDV
ncbi:hypothetical protein F1D05_09755 [Kribbella qitaiheensis]|uniref:DUF1059 domain-containing protein n=1 Tax=Kribbella qitaiheensis TaxID=1544730 RepID=A0A7G6WVV6_9ACTN|nr:hypothetical protein [Kribbella qitaiheensis]QNE18121.1 hypothetical protein F1D05_09755 [Kribbella qitaiheensis]